MDLDASQARPSPIPPRPSGKDQLPQMHRLPTATNGGQTATHPVASQLVLSPEHRSCVDLMLPVLGDIRTFMSGMQSNFATYMAAKDLHQQPEVPGRVNDTEAMRIPSSRSPTSASQPAVQPSHVAQAATEVRVTPAYCRHRH